MIICTPRGPTARTALGAAVLSACALLPGPAVAAPARPPAAGAVLIVHLARSASMTSVAHRLGGFGVRHRFAGLRALSVQVPAGAQADETARLQALPGVASVESGVSRHLFDVSTPNDRYFASKQEGYLDAVGARTAWARQHGSPQVTVAVLDSGADVSHPDLKTKIVDRYNAVDGSTDVTDAVGHGTFVSGVAAAATGNGKGVAGAGWNTSIDAVKIADSAGNINIDDEIAGIHWATQHHADVINLSLGGPDPSRAEAAAVAAAIRAGVVVVAAAGNEGDTARSYPAAYPGVIAVGATDTGQHVRADFSNHGSWVSVAAPGVHVFSTAPANSQMWGARPGGYAQGDGTSFSTPLVAGEAALLRAQNRQASVAQIRYAIAASAHGYPHLGLGAGQVDFGRALAHLAPGTAPAGVNVAGTSGAVRFTAHSSALRVAFRVDGEPRLRSVPVSHGVATAAFGTWGYPNGTHQLRAYDCTAYDECGTNAAGIALPLGNPAPAITGPADGAMVTGRPIVLGSSSVGGPLRLLVDGNVLGFAARAPYRFPVSTSGLADGSHVLQLRACTADLRHCAGPRSAAVTVRSAGLHPEITALSPSHLSPNGDAVHDRATLRFRLPDRETVRARVLDARGTVVRSFALGLLGAGTHSWTWRALSANGPALPDGRYAIALDTVAGARAGWVQRSAVIDTRRPSLARPSTSSRQLYPYRDGFHDTIRVSSRLGEAGRLVLTVRTTSGRTVRTVRGPLTRAGRGAITWNGRTGSGRAVPPGTYRAELSLTDVAGNTTRRPPFDLTVSAKRLRTVTRSVVLPAATFRNAGGTAVCATARRRDSQFPGGLRLINRCTSNGFDLAFADYVFALPPAQRYLRMTFAVRGDSSGPPAELTAAFTRTDGSLEIPRYVTVHRSTPNWYLIAGMPAAHHVSKSGHTRISLLLDSFYAGRNDFDAARVRVRVRMVVLE